MIDGFLEKSEIKSGFECAKEYVKENKLDYIEEEIMMAFRHGFHTGGPRVTGSHSIPVEFPGSVG